MDRTERFYKIDTLLQANRFVPIDRMLRELEVSRATFKRDIEYMRERLNAPIEWTGTNADTDTPAHIVTGSRRCQGCGLTQARPMRF